MVWALGRVRLLWPESLEVGLTPAGLRAVLVHELAHLRRRDHWVGWLVLAAGCLWWWHPLLWLVRRRLHCEAELACDAWVVATLPGARREYAEALLTVCQRWSQPAAAAPALGAAGQRRDLERRLLMVMREQVPYRLSLRLMLGIGFLGFLAIPALTSGQDTKEAPKSPQPEKTTYVAEPTPVKGRVVNEREARIRELEAKVEALLREIQALRGEKAGSGGAKIDNAYPKNTYVPVTAEKAAPAEYKKDTKDGVYAYTATKEYRPPEAADGPVNEVTLTRTTYKLKAAQAEALGKFLSENVKASVMETKVEGDNVIVTTTPEAQRVVTQIIGLMQGKSPTGANYYLKK
jgi:hypothetical protein